MPRVIATLGLCWCLVSCRGKAATPSPNRETQLANAVQLWMLCSPARTADDAEQRWLDIQRTYPGVGKGDADQIQGHLYRKFFAEGRFAKAMDYAKQVRGPSNLRITPEIVYLAALARDTAWLAWMRSAIEYEAPESRRLVPAADLFAAGQFQTVVGKTAPWKREPWGRLSEAERAANGWTWVLFCRALAELGRPREALSYLQNEVISHLSDIASRGYEAHVLLLGVTLAEQAGNKAAAEKFADQALPLLKSLYDAAWGPEQKRLERILSPVTRPDRDSRND